MNHYFIKLQDSTQYISGYIFSFTSKFSDLFILLESDKSYQLILQNIKRDLLRKYYKIQDYKITQEQQSQIYRSFRK